MLFTLAASAFAGDENVDPKISKRFEREFSDAQNATWSVNRNYYQVTFKYQDKTYSAFYDKKGYRMGVSRFILSTELPNYLQKELKEYHDHYWVDSLFELTNDNGTSYFVTLQNADGKLILSSSHQNSWEFYKEYKNP